MSDLCLPAGCDVRITNSGFDVHRWAVLIAPPPLKAEISAFLRPGELSAILIHDPGTHWPDSSGRAVACDVLANGGVVGFEFSSLADALRCEGRLRRGMGS